jgi:hypothetical protein
MKAHPLLQPTSYGPEALDRITKAFDEAWSQIEARIGSDAIEIDAARTALAKAILEAARSNNEDVEAIKAGALKVFLHHFEWQKLRERT